MTLLVPTTSLWTFTEVSCFWCIVDITVPNSLICRFCLGLIHGQSVMTILYDHVPFSIMDSLVHN